MGFFEGTVAGSAYNGELLSSRCQLKKSLHKHNQHDHVSAGAATAADEEIHTSCGKDFAAVLLVMMKKAEYTGEHKRCMCLLSHMFQWVSMGNHIRCMEQALHVSIVSHTYMHTSCILIGAFCMHFKMDDHELHAKIFDMNPRSCHTVQSSSAMFASSFIPISFAAHRERILRHVATVHHKNVHWYSNSTLQKFVKQEHDIAITGNSPKALTIHQHIKSATAGTGS